MKTFAVVSYNTRCNYTNYGSALQSWALKEAIKKLGHNAILVDYCSNAHLDSDPLNPFKKSMDQDEETKRMIEECMPQIKENYYKFDNFYTTQFNRTKKRYDYTNFNEIENDIDFDGFVCGGDTIFCVDEFGIDDGFYANYDVMKKNYVVAYGASFGDTHFTDEIYKKIDERLKNFKAIGIREIGMVDYIKSKVDIPVSKVLDPTLLLEASEYASIEAEPKEKEKYLLLYSRRRNQNMIDFADKVAKEKGLKVIDISLRKYSGHTMAYETGVEEYLTLIKNAEFVVTNSFHGLIFSVIYRKQFAMFSRQYNDTKINEMIDLFGLKDRLFKTGTEEYNEEIDYDLVHDRIEKAKVKSLEFLKNELDNCK